MHILCWSISADFSEAHLTADGVPRVWQSLLQHDANKYLQAIGHTLELCDPILAALTLKHDPELQDRAGPLTSSPAHRLESSTICWGKPASL